MRNIPLFSTDLGVASLILEEIPYQRCAYIRLQDTNYPEEFIAECADFCRMAGAESIYATGDDALKKYPLHTEIWRMICHRSRLCSTTAELVMVKKSTVKDWCEHYNRLMKNVPNAATITCKGTDKLLEQRDAYFVFRENVCIGIGKASGNKLDVVASLIPGCGKDITLALCSTLNEDIIEVEVASNNIRAVKLYERLGFVRSEIISTWYKID